MRESASWFSDAETCYVLDSYNVAKPIIKKIGHEKCLPFEPTRAKTECKINVTPIILPMILMSRLPVDKYINNVAKPNQAIVVKCQAKRKVFFVNSVLPNSLGKLFKRKRRIRIYCSPK